MVELRKVAISLASRGPCGSRPSFSTTCFQMLLQCIWVTHEAREWPCPLQKEGAVGLGLLEALAPAEGRAVQRSENKVPCRAADILWSQSRFNARLYKDGSTERGKCLFHSRKSPNPYGADQA